MTPPCPKSVLPSTMRQGSAILDFAGIRERAAQLSAPPMAQPPAPTDLDTLAKALRTADHLTRKQRAKAMKLHTPPPPRTTWDETSEDVRESYRQFAANLLEVRGGHL